MGIKTMLMPIASAAIILSTLNAYSATIETSPKGPVTAVPIPTSHVIGMDNSARSMDLLAYGPRFTKALPLPAPGDGRYYQPIIIIIVCNLSACTATINFPLLSPNPTTFTTSGSGSLQTVTSSQEGRTTTTFQPVSYNGNGSGPLVGAASWHFDLSRTVQNSSIIANQSAGEYPATADLFVNITGTLGATPGITYISRTPVHLFTPNLNSFNPQRGERWALAGTVAFANAQTPNQTAFTLTSVAATFN